MTPSLRAISGATTLLGPELAPVDNAVVVVEDGKIVAAGSVAEVQIPDDAEVFDALGKTLLPGFIDAHVHIGFYDPSEILAGGVTTVRDLGWPPDRITRVVEDSRDAHFDGPTVIAAGPMLTAPGGYPIRAAWAPEGTGREVSGPEDGREAVTEVADAGFCIVKVALNPPVGPVLDADTLSAIVDAAHDRGLKVTGHIYGLDELEKAIACGIDELAHMLMSEETIPPDTIDRMVAAGILIVPTLSVFSGLGLRTAKANLIAFRAAGGRVVYGTDLGNDGPLPGIDKREVEAMTSSGMTGMDVIRAATVDAADWLGLGTKGVIAPGFDADLVMIKGDPLSDPSLLTSVAGVWRKGRTKGY